MQTRILTTSDAGAYRQLRLRSFQEAPFAFSESYEDEVQRPEADFLEEVRPVGEPPEQFILGVFTEEELVGFVKFRRDLRSKARHKAMVHAMYVDPAFRNLGLGRKLMVEVIDRSQQMPGMEQIHLWVLHASTSASDFYASLGFLRQGPMVLKDLKFQDQYIDAEYMVLYL